VAPDSGRIAVLNDDALPPQRWLEALGDALDRDPRLAAVQGTLTDAGGRIVDGRGITLDRWALPVQVDRGLPADGEDRALRHVLAVSGTAAMWRTEALAEVSTGAIAPFDPAWLRGLISDCDCGAWGGVRRAAARRPATSARQRRGHALAPPVVDPRQPLACARRQSGGRRPARCPAPPAARRAEGASHAEPVEPEGAGAGGRRGRCLAVAGRGGLAARHPGAAAHRAAGTAVRILVATDDTVGPAMAGSALRAFELARVLQRRGHELRLAAPGSSPPGEDGPPLVCEPPWSWAEAVVAPPWSLPPRAFLGRHLLIADGITPLLAELEVMPPTPARARRRRTAAARLPLVAARADALLTGGAAQVEWWSEQLRGRFGLPLLTVPFGIPDEAPPSERGSIPGVPDDWAVVLWWGGVWPWLDLDTLLDARARSAGRR
jgi:hypothetical protein